MEIVELKDKTERLWKLRSQKDEVKRTLDALNEEIGGVETELIEALTQNELDRFDSDSCTIYRQTKTSVKVPKDPENRDLFFAYLRAKGVFDELITVNSQTLNSFFAAELENQVNAGNVSFVMPGIGDPTTYDTLSVRKRK